MENEPVLTVGLFACQRKNSKLCKKRVKESGLTQREFAIHAFMKIPIINNYGLHALLPEIRRISNNLNQLARRCNQGNQPTYKEIAIMRKELSKLWQSLRQLNQERLLRRIIHYVTQEKKTEEPLLAGIHCDPQNAYDDMMLIKTLFRKKGGRQYKHFIYSYPPGESITPPASLGKRAVPSSRNSSLERVSGAYCRTQGSQTYPRPYYSQFRS